MIFTFYSYKGGVGRSMALANVAEWLYEQGLRVIIIDWDLEAPGLENFFYSSTSELDLVRSQLGLIDLLLAYKRAFPRLQLSHNTNHPRNSPNEDEPDDGQRGDFLRTLRESNMLAPIRDGLYPLHGPEDESGDHAALWLLPAGWRSGDRFPVYAHAVQSFDWADFYASFEGEAYFNWMREQLVDETLADVVLIDSRTGVTEMGGVCTRQMADVVVSFCVPNAQNLAGVSTMAESFRRSEIISRRGRELDVVVVPTRIDMNELDLRKAFEDQFRAHLDKLIPASFSLVQSNFWDLQIQYIAKYAYSEKLAIKDSSAPELRNAYRKLAAHLALLGQGRSGLQIRAAMADELQNEFQSRLPSVFISAIGREAEEIGRQLRGRLAEQRIALWPDLGDLKTPGDSWQQVADILDQAKAMVIIVTPENMSSTFVRRQWRYARQQGVSIYLVNSGGFSATVPSEGSTTTAGRAFQFDADGSTTPAWLIAADYYDADSEWQKLASVLQRPVPVTRVPYMAPDLIEGCVPREELTNEITSALLGGSNGAPPFSNIALCGPAGTGKTTTAISACQDESVDAFFEDGILWVTLGEKPDVLAELKKLYAALTGERPPFTDQEEAAKALAGKLTGKHFLLVINDVVALEDLRFFTFGDNRCTRLITTRDLNIAFGANARVIQMGQMTTQESIQLLAEGLEPTGELLHEIENLALQIGNWPLGLRLANAELKKRVQLSHDQGQAVQAFTSDYERRGISMLDSPTRGDGQGPITQKLDSAIKQSLPLKPDYDRFLQLAYFPSGADVTLKDVADIWGLDPSETEKKVEHLRDVSLLEYAPEKKTLRLQPALRSYLLGKLPDREQLDSKLEAAFAHFNSADQAQARSVLTRMVRLTAEGEEGDDSRQRLRLNELDAAPQIIDLLAQARLITVDEDKDSGVKTVQIANEAYLKGWKRLRNWIADDRAFLLWRQQLKPKIAEWESTARDPGALLSGVPLESALTWRDQRREDLNEAEIAYIAESQREAEKSRQAQADALTSATRVQRRGWALIVSALILIVASAFLIVHYVQLRSARVQAEAVEAQARKYDSDGVSQLANRQYDGAIKNFDEAIKAKPDFADAYLHRGNAYAASDKDDKINRAIADYSRAIELDLGNYEAYFRRGNLKLFVDGPNQNSLSAIDDYNHAITFKPDYWEAFLNRGIASEDVDKPDAALIDYTHVLESPADQYKPDAYIRRGLIYYDKKDKQHAIDDMRSVLASTADPIKRDTANKYLKLLGYKPQLPTDPSQLKPVVFVMYVDAKDAAIVDAVSSALKGQYKVMPKQLIVRETKGDVRYYSDSKEIKAAADAIKGIVMNSINGKTPNSKFNLNLNFTLIYLGKVYPYVPPQNIEVWIPSLSSLTPLPSVPPKAGK